MLIFWSILKILIEISLLWAMFYRILVFFEGTRAFHVFKGLLSLLIIFIIAKILGFETINWVLTKFFALSIIVFVVIFQQELRQGLAHLGQRLLFNMSSLEEEELMEIIEELSSAVYKLSSHKIGALIAIEKQTKLVPYIESGVQIQSKITSELVQTIFAPLSPLHDGGIIIRGNKLVSAACLFPLSDNPNFSKIIGTRHRAALGLTEQTDAIVIMVSEETGEISVASEGRFIPIVNKERLINILKSILMIEKKKKK